MRPPTPATVRRVPISSEATITASREKKAVRAEPVRGLGPIDKGWSWGVIGEGGFHWLFDGENG